MCTFEIDADIRRARTPPSALYGDPRWFRAVVERVLVRGWHGVPAPIPSEPGSVLPWTMLPGCVDEPVLFTRDRDGTLHLLSNVCTHRGNLLVERACPASGLRCSYHGRRFALDGTMLAMPEFEDVVDFPGPSDHLPHIPLASWGPIGFSAIAPAIDLEALLAPVRTRLGFLPLADARFSAADSRDYHVPANWALYCDNYLEGFHIPFVHPALSGALDYRGYRTELFPQVSLQIGVASRDEDAFALPADHPDHGQAIAGYYFHLFPTTMINAYPWGLSLNFVQPLSPTSTRVVYQTWIWDESRRGRGAGAGLDQVEFEDERVVERVGQGVRARMYAGGRYSPSREQAVHHFHRALADALR